MIDNNWEMSSSNGIPDTLNYFQPPPLPDFRIWYINLGLLDMCAAVCDKVDRYQREVHIYVVGFVLFVFTVLDYGV